MITRSAMPSSGGPTDPTAVRTFFSAWQLPQPYWMNIASPRSGSPFTSAAACMRRRERCCTYSLMIPISATTNSSAERMPKKALVDRERGMASLRSFEPLVEQRDGRNDVHHAARNPHDQSGEPLVFDGIEADAAHAHRRIIGVPRARGKAHQGAERSSDQRGCEQAGRGNAEAIPAAAR